MDTGKKLATHDALFIISMPELRQALRRGGMGAESKMPTVRSRASRRRLRQTVQSTQHYNPAKLMACACLQQWKPFRLFPRYKSRTDLAGPLRVPRCAVLQLQRFVPSPQNVALHTSSTSPITVRMQKRGRTRRPPGSHLANRVPCQ